MSSDRGRPDEDSWLDDLTPKERAWLETPGNERRGYQPKPHLDDPQEPPAPPDGRASPSPHRSTSDDASQPGG